MTTTIRHTSTGSRHSLPMSQPSAAQASRPGACVVCSACMPTSRETAQAKKRPRRRYERFVWVIQVPASPMLDHEEGGRE